MENHFECLWDSFRSIPSIETPGVSVLLRILLAEHDPTILSAAPLLIVVRDAHTDGKFNLSQKGCMEILLSCL